MQSDNENSSSSASMLYGPQTCHALCNFPAAGRTVAGSPVFLAAYVRVKIAAAKANARCGVLSGAHCKVIDLACQEILAGGHHDQFRTPVLQSTTSTNMNLNEVIATRASQLLGAHGPRVHPNDHVNASQSTNDTYPTALALTILDLVRQPLDALEVLASAFEGKAGEFDQVRRLGRTCLQDAVTVGVGQTHRAQARAVRRACEGVRAAAEPLHEVPLGTTALGTGVGAPVGFAAFAVTELAASSGHPLVPAADPADVLAHLDGYAALAATVARAATTLSKIAADLRFLASGPAGGLGELFLPEVQAGSSIMPGKINPVIPEYVMQLGQRIQGCVHTVDLAVAAGELELNVMAPTIADAMLVMLPDLATAAETFADRCVAGMRWNLDRVAANAKHAYDGWVEIAASRGYDATTAEVRGDRQHRASGTAGLNG